MNVDQIIEYIDDNKDYLPMCTNHNVGYTYGGWKDWVWLKKNKPYVMKGMYSNASPTLQRVNENLYSVTDDLSTITLDGSDPDVDGIYAFIPKIYYRETYVSEDVREVEFTNNPKSLEEGFINTIFIDKDGKETAGIFVPSTFTTIDLTNERIFSGWNPTVGLGNGNTQDNTFVYRCNTLLKEKSNGYGCWMSWRLMMLMRDITIMLYKRVINLESAMGYGINWSIIPSGSINVNNNWINPQEEMMDGQFYGMGTERGTSETDAVLKTFHTAIFSNFRKGFYIWDWWYEGGLVKVTKNLNYSWLDNPEENDILTSNSFNPHHGKKIKFEKMIDGFSLFVSYSSSSFPEAWYFSTSGYQPNNPNASFLLWGRHNNISSSIPATIQDIRSVTMSQQVNPNQTSRPLGNSWGTMMPIYIFPDEFLKGVLKDD